MAQEVTVKTLKEWADRINDEGRGLTSWEKSFMESVTEQLDGGSGLSDRQHEILEKIYVEKVP